MSYTPREITHLVSYKLREHNITTSFDGDYRDVVCMKFDKDGTEWSGGFKMSLDVPSIVNKVLNTITN